MKNSHRQTWERKDYILYFSVIIPAVTISLSLIYYLIEPNAFHSNLGQMFLQSAYPTIVIWSGCSAIVSILWKKFPWEKNPLKHLIYEIVFIAIYLVLFLYITILINKQHYPDGFISTIKSNGLEIFNTYLITFLIVAVHEAFFFHKQWKKHFSKSIQLEKDNLQAQYNALKAQINPHFLFNSLNSLISLVECNPKAEKYIQDLSEFLRFVLQSSEKETVSLKDEIENLIKYISLLELRFGENIKINLEIDPKSLQREIPPLALQILVENSVQHNIITKADPLHISIKSRGNNISISNNLQKKQKSESTGHGLKNIKGRYRFHNTDEVRIEQTDEEFCVTLPLI